jgi:hypothetical protein
LKYRVSLGIVEQASIDFGLYRGEEFLSIDTSIVG